MSPIHRGPPGTEPWVERILRALGLRADGRLERVLAVSLERVLPRLWNAASEQKVLVGLVTTSPRHVGLSTIAGIALRHAPLNPDVGCVLIAAFCLTDDDPAYRAGLGNRTGSGDTGYWVGGGASKQEGRASTRWVHEPRRLGDMLAVLLEQADVRGDVRTLATDVLCARPDESTTLARLRAIQDSASSGLRQRKPDNPATTAPRRVNTKKHKLLRAVVSAERATVKELVKTSGILPNTIRKYANQFEGQYGDHFSQDESSDGVRTFEWTCPEKDGPCNQCLQLGARSSKQGGAPRRSIG